MDIVVMAEKPVNGRKSRRNPNTDRPPQDTIDEFWEYFITKSPGKPFRVLPDDLYARRAALQSSKEAVVPQSAVASYDQAAAECRAKVERIGKHCRSRNQKYTDPHFDIEFQLRRCTISDTLRSLRKDEREIPEPQSVKRVEDIFEEPHFYAKGMATSGACRGLGGTCYLVSAISILCNNSAFLEKVCVARDEKVGVYGFVFFRDGEWFPEVIDDKLYLREVDWHESARGWHDWLRVFRKHPEQKYRKSMQTGSKALHFAKCKDQNTTWLPLLEKAYAKAHGDYTAIRGGHAAEALEDLTGGVPSEVCPTDILDKNKFWTEELMNVNKTFVFSLSLKSGIHEQRKGIHTNHSYSIMEAGELDKVRLLKIRNPWGKKGWDGRWSNRPDEWTPKRIRRLEHKSSDDGTFWISYEDLLEDFSVIERTRLLGSDWFLTQQWTSVNVPWAVNYLDTRFQITFAETGPAAFVLSQLDDRYFCGLEGQYDFKMQFRLHKSGEDEYIGRSNQAYLQTRSASLELDLEAGEYTVIFKIAATRDWTRKSPQDVAKMACKARPNKLLAVGLSYDLAHAKGRLKESEDDRQEQLRRERREKRKRTAKKNFEARRGWDRKAKLRLVRLKAIKDAKKSGRQDHNGKDEVDIMLKDGENTFESSDQAAHNNGVFEHAVTGKKLKVTVEATGSKKAEHHHEGPDSASSTKPIFTHESSTGDDLQAGGKTVPDKGSEAGKLTHKLASFRLDPPPPPPKPTFDDISDDSLSWSSDIDAPSDTDSDIDSISESAEDEMTQYRECAEEMLHHISEDVHEEIIRRDPWNAVCVLGLRVYSQGSQAKVKVVRKMDDNDSVKQAADATKGLGRQSEEEEKKLKDLEKPPEHEEEPKQG